LILYFYFQDTINKKSLRFETEPQLESLMTQADEGSIEAFFCRQLFHKDFLPTVGPFIKKLELIEIVVSRVLSTKQ